MPKSFSDSERVHIKQRLMQEAKQCLSRYGIKKTTVDELVKRVNISKGAFYLFYDSKELLFFDVLCAFQDEIKQRLLFEIKNINERIDAEKLTDIIFGLYKMVEGSSILKFMLDEEIELLIRKLPPEIAEKHAVEDDFSLEQLVCLIPDMNTDRVPAFSAALRGIFLSMLHKHEIGEDVFDDALRIMIKGVVTQMFIRGEKI
ncbi:MAG: TetR/AcrR family transcriptional regulator [Clostridiaceae bacterium]|nr:TetR/AcrR family transcriptional regulator [Clostridiaceae bacterium]